MRRQLLVTLFCALSLAACGGKAPEPDVKMMVDRQTLYPTVPDISLPPKPDLVPWEMDIPRDTSKPPQVKNQSSCLSVAKEAQDAAFWRRCGEHPPATNSNIFAGMDRSNFDVMTVTLQKINVYVQQLEQRIQQANQMFQGWRDKNTQTLGNPTPTPPATSSVPVAPSKPVITTGSSGTPVVVGTPPTPATPGTPDPNKKAKLLTLD